MPARETIHIENQAMPIKHLLRVVGALLLGVLLAACELDREEVGYVPDVAESIQAQAAVNLVEAAIAAYEDDPAATLQEIETSSGPWLNGSLYVSVVDQDGFSVSHAANPSLVGQDLSPLIDSDGYELVVDGVRLASEDGSWLLYRYINPANGLPEPKRAYSRLVDGLLFTVGYYLSDDRYIKHVVNDALEVWRNDSDRLNILQSDPRFTRGESYVFVARADDLTYLTHPSEPRLRGTSAEGLTDLDGKKFAREMRERADADGEWVHYIDQNPETGAAQKRQIWAVRIDDVIIGAGTYGPSPP